MKKTKPTVFRFDYLLYIFLALLILRGIGKFLYVIIYGSEEDVKKYVDDWDDDSGVI
ncbi:hypothetical protein [Tenacibaculum litopenaei]|uniref:hypothetical protein n=1 Tax=Tenacibaculum litopenaei TaxID=396016 RepID=UPI0038B5A4DF